MISIPKLFFEPPAAAVERINFPLHYPAGAIYFIVGAVYTVLVFWVRFADDSRPILSKQNARPLSVILLTHSAFMALILEGVWLATSSAPFLPDWLTDRNRRGNSGAEYLLFVILFVLRAIECRWIYVESETDTSHSGKDST